MPATYVSVLLLLFSLNLTPVLTASAPVTSINPPSVQYIAVLPDKNDTLVRGAVQVNSNANGTGVTVQVSVSGLPAQGGPYSKLSGSCIRHTVDACSLSNP